LKATSFALVSFFVLFAAPFAQAQTITGRVVDVNGVGIAGVDLDVENNGGGGDPSVSQDFTDAAGNFTTTVVPAGIYDLVFSPPRPPTSTHLKTRLTNRAVVGVVNLGTIVLPRGVSLGGRVVTPGGAPIAGVDLDVRVVATGTSLELVGDTTDAFGSFLIAVPPEPIQLQVDPRGLPLVVYAPLALDLAPSVNTNVGDQVLRPGFTISGFLRSNGLPVSGADFDLRRSATGVDVFVQQDTSSATGAFSWIVASGTYDIEIKPKAGDLFVALEALGVPLTANQGVGVLQLESGVVLSGNVQACEGGPAADVDVQVTRSSGQEVALARDNTDPAGNYAVVVPFGTLDVAFRHPTLGRASHPGVFVNGPTFLNARVSPVAAVVRNGAGVNALRYSNATLPRLGGTWTTQVDCSGHPNGFVIQTASVGPVNGPILPSGQVLIGGGTISRLTRRHTGGTVSFNVAFPNSTALCGLKAYTQVLIGGGAAELTNAIDITLGH
jgi:hypothetical protein